MKKVRIYSAFCQSNQNDWRFYLVQVRANNKKKPWKNFNHIAVKVVLLKKTLFGGQDDLGHYN